MALLANGTNNPGVLDRRVSLVYDVPTRDAVGGEVSNWILASPVWAGKFPIRGGRLSASDAKHSEAELRFRIRHRMDVSPFWHLIHGDDVYEITYIEEVGRRLFLDLYVRAIDQSPSDARSVLLLHNQSPMLLHSGGFLELHGSN